MRRSLLTLPAVAGALVVACSSTTTSNPMTNDIGPVTFYKDVQPILQERCQGCHSDGGIAPFALVTYEGTKGYAPLIVQQTADKVMPPWGAHESTECTPRFAWKHDMRLTQRQIDIFAAWQKQGTPAGDPKDAPPAVTPPAYTLAAPDVELRPQTPFTITDLSKDTFQCVVLDPKITQETWINGVHFVPGNHGIAHHAVLFVDEKRESLKKVGPDGTYPCFGSAGLSNQALLGAWAPGAPPRDYPSEVGLQVKPGTLFVAQMHYHPSVNDPAANKKPDDFKLQLRYTKAPPQYNLVFALLGNFNNRVTTGTGLYFDGHDPNALSEFKIPANTKDKTVTMQVMIPTELNKQPLPKLQLLGVGAHMHWVGTKATIKVRRATPSADQPAEECLLNVPRWDFNWQQGYAYDVPLEKLPSFAPFDLLSMTCTYDNTLGNKYVAQALKEQGLTQPMDVKLGENTLDEMCLGVYELIFKRP